MTAAPVLARSLKYSLQISQGENAGQVYAFEKPVITIGRGPQNDVILGNDPKASRIHAEIRIEAGFLKVSNLSEKNFILINGEKTDYKFIQQSSALQIGDTVFQIKIEAPAVAPALPSVARTLALKPTAPPAMNSQPMNAVGSPQKPAPSFQGTSTQFRPMPAANDNSRMRFYIIVAVIGAALAWVVLDSNSKKKVEIGLRTEGDIVRAIEESTVAVKELKRQQENSGQNSIQYQSAQEHYIKGFRDYRQRQYARAMQSFQAALSFYPSHELARKYLVQSQRKFEETVDSNMSLGRKYYQRQNYKLCQSSFANVMIMLKDSSKPKYREAKQVYDECRIRLEGRF